VRLCFAALLIVGSISPLRAQASVSVAAADTLRAGHRELAVYAAALDSVYAKDWWPTDSMLVGTRTERVRHFVLERASSTDSIRFFADLARVVAASDAILVRTLFSQSTCPAVIVDSVPMQKRHALVDHDAVAERGSTYPHSVRHPVSLSRVAFSEDGKRAVVFVRLHCRNLCARGDIVSLELRGGRWVVRAVVNAWSS
jgi:hypothetical protein